MTCTLHSLSLPPSQPKRRREAASVLSRETRVRRASESQHEERTVRRAPRGLNLRIPKDDCRRSCLPSQSWHRASVTDRGSDQDATRATLLDHEVARPEDPGVSSCQRTLPTVCPANKQTPALLPTCLDVSHQRRSRRLNVRVTQPRRLQVESEKRKVRHPLVRQSTSSCLVRRLTPMPVLEQPQQRQQQLPIMTHDANTRRRQRSCDRVNQFTSKKESGTVKLRRQEANDDVKITKALTVSCVPRASVCHARSAGQVSRVLLHVACHASSAP